MPKEIRKQKSVGLILLISLVLIGVIFLGVYLIRSPLSHTSNTPACQYDPDVCMFFTAMQKRNIMPTGSLIATITTTTQNQPASQIIVRADGKNNLSITSYKNGALQGESILYANNLYTKNPKDNTWIASPTPVDSALRNFRQKTFAEINKTGVDASYVFIRSTPCKELTCMKYQRML